MGVFKAAGRPNQNCPWKSLSKSPAQMIFPPSIGPFHYLYGWDPNSMADLWLGAMLYGNHQTLSWPGGMLTPGREEGMMIAWTFTRLKVSSSVRNRDRVSISSAISLCGRTSKSAEPHELSIPSSFQDGSSHPVTTFSGVYQLLSAVMTYLCLTHISHYNFSPFPITL